jgi:hypothetical protein
VLCFRCGAIAAGYSEVIMNADIDTILLLTSQAARAIGVSPDTLERMALRGEAPPRVKVSRQWRYPLAGLRQWKADRSQASVAAA